MGVQVPPDAPYLQGFWTVGLPPKVICAGICAGGTNEDGITRDVGSGTVSILESDFRLESLPS